MLEIIIAPIRLIRLRYIPLLLIYFAYGASSFIGIAESFWFKDELELDISYIVILNAWIIVPWTSKMIFGQVVDSIKIWGSNRKIYIFIGAVLMGIATILTILVAKGIFPTKEYNFYLYSFASVLAMVGFVIQDVVADTMTTEVVDRSQTQEKIKQELAVVQILARLSLGLGFLIMPPLGGYLFNGDNYLDIFTLSLFVPIVSIIGVLFIDLDEVESSPINKDIIFGGLALAISTILIGYSNFAYSQELIFLLSFVIVLYFLNEMIQDLDKDTIHNIKMVMIIIFVYQAIPHSDEIIKLWQMNVFDFKKEFFIKISLIGGVLGFLGLWFSTKYIIRQSINEKSIGKVLLWLVAISTILSISNLLIHYKVFNIDAQSIFLIATTLSAPFKYFAMVLMLTLIAIHAPKGKTGTWFALMTSFINIAIQAGGLFNKYLINTLHITKENYSEFGTFLWVVTIVGSIIPIITILIFDKKIKIDKKTSLTP